MIDSQINTIKKIAIITYSKITLIIEGEHGEIQNARARNTKLNG